MTSEYRHIPVLLPECMKYLKLSEGKTYVDATLGGAGHSLEAAKLIGPTGHLLGIDQDDVARAAASERLAALPDDVRPEVDVLAGNFGELDSLLVSAQIPSIDAILFDIGVSSVQIDTPSRGFSFKETGPLDMRMDQRNALSAYEVVNDYSEENLSRILHEYGEERFARKIAHNICVSRQQAPIRTTGELIEIIKRSIPAKIRATGGHPAKRTFQAIRIEVNQELTVLSESLDGMIDLLNDGGRLCVITFHSLEDRIVKNIFRKNEHPCTCPPEFPVCVCGKKSKGTVVTRKPILPGEEEMETNPRSKSAKLRVFERKV